MFSLLLVLTSIAFIGGQLTRLNIINGVAVTLLDITVTFTVFTWLTKKILRKEKNTGRLKNTLHIFILTGIISLLANSWIFNLAQIGIASLYLLRFMIYSELYFIVKDLSAQKKQKIKYALVSTGILNVLLGVLQFIFYPNLKILYSLGWDDHLYRMFGTLLDPNYFGSYLVLLFILVFQFKFKEIKKKDPKIISVLVLILLGIILTYSRSAIIMAVSAIFGYFIIKKDYKKMLLVIGVFIISVLLLSNTHIEGLNPFRTASSKARVESVQNALTIIKDHSVFGVGFNAYRYAQNMYGFRTSSLWQKSHADAGTDNSFLFIIATTGVLGFISYLYFFKKIFELKNFLKGEEEVIFVTFFISLIVGSIFNNLLFYTPVMAILFIYLGLMESR